MRPAQAVMTSGWLSTMLLMQMGSLAIQGAHIPESNQRPAKPCIWEAALLYRL